MPTETADQLIGAIARGERKPDSTDGERVRQHVSAAAFNREVRPESSWARLGESVVGCPHPSRPGENIRSTTSLSSLEFHIAKRIKGGHWKPVTTPDDYEADRRRRSKAYLVKAGVRGVALAALQARVTTEDYPRVEIRPGYVILVVYDTSKQRITTGYCLPETEAPNRVYKYWIQKPRPVVLPLSKP